MSVQYRQCHLVQPRDRAMLHYTTWLPEAYAVPGGVVRLRQADGTWGTNWEVASVGPWSLPEDLMRKAERAHLKQRKASDI
jgi:hypothetical protein